MRKILRVFMCIFLSMFYQFNTYGAVINSSGKYFLSGDRVNTSYTGNMIRIQASNVTLEMDAHIISGGSNGIVIESGVSGVVIQNGFIGDATNAGIQIKDNISVIRIKNVGISRCGGPGIEVLGTVTGVNNVYIEETSISACSSSLTSSSALSIEKANNVIFKDSIVNYCGNLSNTINLVEIKNSDSIVFLNLLFSDNYGAALRGVLIDNSKKCLAEQVRIIDNLATTGDFTGFLLQNSAHTNGISMCKVITGSSVSGDVIGYDVSSGSSENIFCKCEASSLEGENAYGFYVHGTGTPSDTLKNSISECIVINNKARTGNAIGALISRADKSILCKSYLSNQSAPSGVAAGISFASGTGGDTWSVCENKILENVGSSDANSYGINRATGSSNLFTQNIASENGSTSGNQLSGVPVNSVTLASVDLINTITLPWTNIGITP